MGCSYSQPPAMPEYIRSNFGLAQAPKEETSNGPQTHLGSSIRTSAKISSYCKLCEKIGEGASSSVYAAKKRGQTEKAWAVKVVKIRTTQHVEHGAAAKNIVNEIEIWRRVGEDKNIVRCHEVFEDDQRCFFVMERCDGGVVDYIWRAHAITEQSLAPVFRQMLAAISHVHSLGVVHRDIKPSNFLHCNGIVKLSDFGLSFAVPGTILMLTSRGKADSHVLSGTVGTAPFMSPEMVLGDGHGLPTDMWSFGAMAYVMLLGFFPYHPHEVNAASVKHAIAQGTPPPSFKPYRACQSVPALLQPFGHVRHAAASSGARISPAATSFLRSLLQRDACRRVDACAALKDPYLKCAAGSRLQHPPCLRDNFRMAMCAGAFHSIDVVEHKHAPFQLAISDATTETGATTSTRRSGSTA